MEYAYQEAVIETAKRFTAQAKEMNDAYEKIVDIMDGLDLLPINCNCDY